MFEKKYFKVREKTFCMCVTSLVIYRVGSVWLVAVE